MMSPNSVPIGSALHTGNTTALGEPLATLQAKATALGLAVMEALPSFRTDNGTRICPEVDYAGDVDDFFALAKAVGAPLVYFGQETFDLERELRFSLADEGMEEALEIDEETESDDAEDALAERYLAYLRQALGRWADHDGEPEILSALWMCGGVAHRWQQVAEWQEDFDAELTAALADARGELGDQRASATEDRAATRHAQAVALAQHPRWKDATNDAKRLFMAEQLFPDFHPIERRQIAEMASVIYWWDIEPSERASLAQRVRDLSDAGESAPNIAAILGISLAKVRTIIRDKRSAEDQ